MRKYSYAHGERDKPLILLIQQSHTEYISMIRLTK